MRALLAIILLCAIGSPQPVLGKAPASPIMPSVEEMEVALTAARFDDSCQGPGPDDGCPMINIFHVKIRGQKCEHLPAHLFSKYVVQAPVAVRCRFESGIATTGQKEPPRKWRRDQAIFYTSDMKPTCHEYVTAEDDGDHVDCRRDWSASPSLRID